MKILKTVPLFIGLLSLVLVSSCTMEKRLYTHGYHVEWHLKKGAHSAIKPEKEVPIQFIETEKDIQPIEIQLEEELTFFTPKSNNFEESAGREKIILETAPVSIRKIKVKRAIADIKSGVNMARTIVVPEGEEQKMHGLAVAGFVIALVGWFMPLGLALTFLALGIIFGAIAMSAIKKNPEKFKGRGLAIAAFVVALVGLVIVLAVI